MHVLFIRNYKKKMVLALLITAVWALVILATNFFLHNTMAFHMTINNYLTFSYPFNLQVENVYYNESLEKNSIQTNSNFKKPLAQKFSSYKSIKGSFSFKYPSAFTLNEQNFIGSDILYHIDFINRSPKSHGFVQVWSLPYALKDFLENSKSNSSQNLKDFKSEEVTVNGLPGYMWDYVSAGSDKVNYKAKEVFLQKNDRMYRISYFVPENLWSNTQDEIFRKIVNSLKTE